MSKELPMLVLGCAIGLSALGTGCRRIPVHSEEVVCEDVASATSCSPDTRERVFSEWSEQALDAPGSTFTLWTIGEDGKAATAMKLCVPRHWAAGASQHKAAFQRLGRLAVRGQRTAPQGCDTDVPAVPGASDQLTTVVFHSDGRSHEWPSSEGEPLHVAAVCDISDSTVGQACSREALVGAFQDWAVDSALAPGSSFRVVVVGRGFEDSKRLFMWRAPEGSAGYRVASALAAQKHVEQVALAQGTGGSAIAEALSVASSELGQERGRRGFVVLSDLRQVTGNRINFERAIPDSAGFVKWLRAEELVSDLRGGSVRVCGVHRGSIPNALPFSAKDHKRVKDTWEFAFRAMGGTDIRFTDGCEPREGM